MAWYHRLLNTTRSERLSKELAREMEFHLAECVDELMAGGMSEAEARREARLRFGNPSLQQERTREVDVFPFLESVLADLRYALRSLRVNPVFALVAVLSLGLGIGANTVIFSLVDAVMLRSLPVSRPEELVRLTMGGPRADEFTNPLWEEIRDRQEIFSGAFAFSGQRFDLASGGEVRPVEGAWVTGAFFHTLGVRAAAGRVLGPVDDHRGCPAVAVLGHAFWKSAYGGDAATVGKTLPLNGHPFEIVGVADPAFFGVEVGKATQVYTPLCAKAIIDGGDGGLDKPSYWFLRIIGRRRDGLTATDVRGRLAAMAPAVFGATIPSDLDTAGKRGYLEHTLDVEPAANGYSDLRNQYRDALLALMVVVGLVLLIACANVANLLLARATARRREVAIRLAIGAGRGRLIRQLLTESLVLSLLGAVVGLVFASWVGGLLVRLLSTRGSAVWLDLSVDGRLLAFTFVVATATAILFGLAPAWRSTRVEVQSAMKAVERRMEVGRSWLTAGRAILVGQIALSLVLVLGAGLLLGTFRKLVTLDPGFQRDGVLLATVELGNAGFPDEQLPAVKREILDRLRATVDIRSVSASAFTPISGAGWSGSVTVDGYTPTDRRDAIVFFNAVSDDYFVTLGTPLFTGRDFDESDVPGSQPVAVINQAMARKFFRDTNPLGRRIGVRNGPGPERFVAVVGIVGDTKYGSLREETKPLIYLPMSQEKDAGQSLHLALRGHGPAPTLIPAVAAVVGRVNRNISLRYSTLSEQVDASLSQERLLANLSGFFGALALLLAVVGLYGTVAYAMAQRRAEIGIRLALGAARAGIMRLVLGEVGRLVAVGVLLGAAAAAVGTRWLTPFLFGLTPSDPAVWAASALTLAAAAFAAGALPAWRAAKLDPMVALRED